MSITADVQTLDPGHKLTFYEVDGREIGGELHHFHANPGGGIIWWQGVDYAAIPLIADGYAKTGSQPPTPRLTIANPQGVISALCLAYDDMVGAKVTRYTTYVKYVDAANFDGGNPDADPEQCFIERYWIERKVSEGDSVEFELSSPMRYLGRKFPGRNIIANYCSAEYRGPTCGYIGPPVADANDTPTSDPALDRCGKRLASCKMRLWPDGVLNFNGFPSVGLIR